MLGADYANSGVGAILATTQPKPCCDDCGNGGKPCSDAAARAALIAGITDELRTAKWFLDHRWTIIGGAFAAGGVFFATVAYFVNRDK